MTLSPLTLNPPSVYGQPPLFGQVPAPLPRPTGDTFAPQFGGKRLQGGKKVSSLVMLLGILLGGGTVAYAATQGNDAAHGGGGPSQHQIQNFRSNLDAIVEAARFETAYIAPASGQTAPDVMLRNAFCRYLTDTSRAIAAYNNDSGKYLMPDNIRDCFPEVVFDPTAFSNLMWKVHNGNGWNSIEKNYDDALRVIFGNDSTRLSEKDKKILLEEAEHAFRALEKADVESGHDKPGAHGDDKGFIDQAEETYDRIRKDKIMLALMLISGALIVGGVGGRIVFGLGDRADQGIHRMRDNQRAKRKLKELKNNPDDN